MFNFSVAFLLFQYSAVKVPYPKDSANIKVSLDTEQKDEVNKLFWKLLLGQCKFCIICRLF